MDAIPTPVLIRSMLTLWREVFEGAPDPERSTWLTSNAAGSGFFDTLSAVSVERASSPVLPGRPTIAAHTQHVRFSLAAARAWMRGEDPRLDWASSWNVPPLDQRAWEDLRGALRREYEGLLRDLEPGRPWDENLLTGALAGLAHAAYHLGVVRSMSRQEPARSA